jgi:hypothetical protein
MDGTGDHRVKLNKPDSERQKLHAVSHMQNLDLKKKKKDKDIKGILGKRPAGREERGSKG